MPRTVTPETAVKHEIKRWLNLFGWRCWYNLQGLGAYKGIPDMTAIKKGVVIWIECKSERGVQSPAQKGFQDMIEQQGGYYILARSSQDVEDYLVRNHIQQYRRLL
jgi:hypothetical protein